MSEKHATAYWAFVCAMITFGVFYLEYGNLLSAGEIVLVLIASPLAAILFVSLVVFIDGLLVRV